MVALWANYYTDFNSNRRHGGYDGNYYAWFDFTPPFQHNAKYTMQDAISAPVFGDTIKLTKYIICVTACTEAAGALCLLPVFKQHYGWLKAIWYSVFHAISAFCNAGIDLNGVEQPYCSLTHYYNNPVVNFVIMFLIVFGGIGFITWDDMRRNGFKFKNTVCKAK